VLTSMLNCWSKSFKVPNVHTQGCKCARLGAKYRSPWPSLDVRDKRARPNGYHCNPSGNMMVKVANNHTRRGEVDSREKKV
jgi:hypothetical protein